MAKRAQRRHHEERVKDKFRKVAKEQMSSPATFSSDLQRMRFIEKTALKMAHHPRHQCNICRMDEKALEDKRQFEAKKKAPITEDE